jgi:dipeptidyl aminopeptidase/acylaminoacyl peptidase
MRIKKSRSCCGSLTILVFMAALSAFPASPPSLDSLFRTPLYSYASLSIDGKYFAALYSQNDQTALMTYDIQKRVYGRTYPPDYCDVYDYDWVSNEELIYQLSRSKRFVESVGVVSRDLKFDRTIVEGRLVSVVDGLVSDRNHALLWFRRGPSDNYSFEELSLFDIASGRQEIETMNFPGRVLEWRTDRFGRAGFARVYRKNSGGIDDFYVKNLLDKKWRKLLLSGLNDFSICGFSNDGSQLYVSAYSGKNTSSLCLLDVQKGVISREVYNDPEYDFDGRLQFFSRQYFSKQSDPLGITYRDTSIWFDSSMRCVQQQIDLRLPKTKNHIIDADTGLTRFLIASYSDVQPTRYMLYQEHNREMRAIAGSMPWLNTRDLCPTERIAFVTHDSLHLQGFFTRPKGRNSPYPTVVLLHGGPQLSDFWGFDPEVQSLATRGYAVLQVNYRGSKGFGRKVSSDCRYDYFKMHEDVTEATKIVIRDGLADSNRTAIMGSSFGGYLAVSGVAFDPDLYSCAITNAGVFDWNMQHRHFADYANCKYRDDMRQYLSSKGDVRKILDDASPIHKAHLIKVPVLIAGGWVDEQVPITQSFHLERKMRWSGNKPETFFKFDETHGFHFEENRIKYYEKVLSFLAKNIDRTKRPAKK